MSFFNKHVRRFYQNAQIKKHFGLARILVVKET